MAVSALPYLLPEIQDTNLQIRKYVNFLICMMSRCQGNTVLSSKPLDLTINPSTACQLACPYCATGNGTMQRPATNLSPALHDTIVGGLLDELFVIRYFGTGESLLNKDFSRLLQAIKGKEIFTFITTNLSFPLTDNQVDRLLMSGLNILAASIDGIEQDSYAKHRIGGDYELIIDNMRRLIARKKELGLQYPLIEWRFLVFQHNLHEIESVRRLGKELGIDLLEVERGAAKAPGVGRGDESINEVPFSEYNENVGPTLSGPAIDAAITSKNTRLRQLLRDTSIQNTLPPAEYRFKKCDWHYFSSYIYPDGSVGPCSIDMDSGDEFGKITQHTHFNDIWNNEKYTDARAFVTEGKKTHSFCESCVFRVGMDQCFNSEVRGILWNSPDWVLKVLSGDPDLFFPAVDRFALNAEIQAISQNQDFHNGSYTMVGDRLRELRDRNLDKAAHLTPLIELLEQPLPAPEPHPAISKIKSIPSLWRRRANTHV